MPVNNEPIVTVIIPCHNREKWILNSINSVLRQNYKNKRIFVIDDGSKDESFKRVISLYNEYETAVVQTEEPKEIVRGFVNKTPLISVRMGGARGPSAARNYGIRCSINDSDLIMFLDDDDEYLDNKIDKSVKKWLDCPDMIGIVYSDYYTVSPQETLRIQYKEPFDRNRLCRECIIPPHSLVSCKALKECGLFDEDLRVTEDFDLWLRITEKFVAVHISEPLVKMRVGEHSSTSTVNNEIWQKCYSRTMQKLMERMGGQRKP